MHFATTTTALTRFFVLVLALAAFANVEAAPDQVFTSQFEACDGIVKGGSCFWFGENNESCDTVCGIHGGYAQGTRYLAGSQGDATTCGELLTAFAATNALPVTEQASLSGISGMGCASDYSSNAVSYRFTSTTTSVASSVSNGSLYVRRVCACAGQPAPISVTYPAAPLQLPRGVAMTSATPTLVGYAKSYSVSPALPTGMNLNTQTGVISGTPTALQDPAQIHTVTASNGGGTATTPISVRVFAQPPSGLTYPGAPFVFNKNVAVSPVAPSVFGFVSNYTFAPLPAGLSISTSTGVLSGTPTVEQSAQNYVVTAHNVDGTDSVSISITVQAPLSCGAGGIAVGGTCWYFGANNESCTTVCTAHGGYNAATLSYAGSGGNDANCGAVLTALNIFTPTPVTAVSSLGGISGMGCGSDYTNNATSYRLTSATTAAASSASNGSLFFRRACSCNN